jgi:DNA (cytosine-5)-methyltransferase 1
MRVCELFAGVGGFRLGLEDCSDEFRFVWANQWEPSKKVQHAYDCYIKRFGENENHVNEDISKIDKRSIPEHDLLVGGFPCQDYSVARTGARGIQGVKGVLWWQIREILREKQPRFVLLENVDRLLKSPAKQRGRDFAIMLACFNDLGYSVEWRVINAAEYGFVQRRRRIFIYAFKNDTNYFNKVDVNNLEPRLVKNPCPPISI